MVRIAPLRRLSTILLPALVLLTLAAALPWLLSADSIQAQADTTRPTITAGPTITSSPANGDTYGKDETIVVTVTFSEAVTVTGEPWVRLTMGERNRWARYSSGSGTTTLTFAYTLRDNDTDPDGISIGKNALKLRGGTIADADGNAARLKHPALDAQAGHKVDGSPPQVTAGPTITSSPAGGDTYGKDEAIVVTLTFSEAVSVTGQPRVRLTMGERNRWARYSSGDGATTLSFAYTVRTNDRDEGGVSIGANQLQLRGGSIADGGGNAASLDHPALPSQSGHKVAGSPQSAPADEPGAVSLDPQAPQAGSPVSATLIDPDGSVSGQTWSWASSSNGTDWTAIAGANAQTYTPAAEDVGNYLRATASYTDAHGPGKTAVSAAIGPVAATVTVQRPEPQAQTTSGDPQEVRVPLNWALIPKDSNDKPLFTEGQSFRLLFVSSTTRNTQSADIGVYNKLVQDDAGANTHLARFKSQFRVLGSTPSVAARDNTATNPTAGHDGPGVPIYWIKSDGKGEKVADDYSDFYDGSWDSQARTTPSGAGSYYRYVATGSRSDGTGYAGTGGGAQFGGTWSYVGLADLGRGVGGELFVGAGLPKTTLHPFYGLSPVITVSAVNCAAATATGQECTVPPDWSLIPTGVSPGDSFRLMFVTSTGIPATSRDIATYNTFVQGKAEKNRFLKSFASTFRALGSAWDVHARPNTFTRAGDIGASEPIYWVNGHRVTDTYPNLYDKSWDYNVHSGQYPTTETGGTITDQWLIWTGTEWNGNPATGTQLGNNRVVAGKLNLGQHELRSPPDAGTDEPVGNSYSMYALSPLLTVEEEITVWSATLTVDAYATFFGCDNSDSSFDDCSTTSVLTDDSFDYAGVTYTVDWLYTRANGALRLSFNGIEGRAAKTALSALTLNVDGTALAIKDATGDSDEVWWVHTPSPAWAGGTKVALTLTAPAPPAKPSGFTASPGNTEVTLRWTDPSDASITKYQYQQKAGTGAYGEWMDISDSSPTITSHTVTGLMNWTAYTFRIRAVNPTGPSAASSEATATPMTVVDCAAVTATGQECTVPADWPLIPSGVESGDSFRLMFVTSASTPATSQNIATYNTFVQGHAEKNPLLKPFKSTFRALGSAWDVHARPNTFTRDGDLGASDPIYWVNGHRVTDTYANLYDKSWDYNVDANHYPRTETGGTITSQWEIWTGTEWNGNPATGTQLGNNRVVAGKLNLGQHELRSPPENPGARDWPATESRPMYALSPLLTVEDLTYWSATLTVDALGSYFGCNNENAGHNNCSDVSVLTDDDFDYNGVTYTVNYFYWINLGSPSILLDFGSSVTGNAVKAALGALTLNMDGTALAIRDAHADSEKYVVDAHPVSRLDRRDDGLAVADRPRARRRQHSADGDGGLDRLLLRRGRRHAAHGDAEGRGGRLHQGDLLGEHEARQERRRERTAPALLPHRERRRAVRHR